MFQKRIPYRNKKILDSARGKPCTLNWENCNYDNATTVFAHFDEQWAGKGKGQKADDCAGMHACSACHEDYGNHRIPIEDEWMIRRAYYRTIRSLIDEGIL